MLKIKLLIACIFICAASFAQTRYFTKTGKIVFTSKAPMESIEGTNKTILAVMDTKSGALQFAAQMKSFEFEKQLMQEHFNENYVESDKFPKAEFKGQIINNTNINYSKDGTYPATVKGKLTIHGVTKDVQASGSVKIAAGKINTTSVFTILLSDYEIKIPSLVKDKVSNSVTIDINCLLEMLKG